MTTINMRETWLETVKVDDKVAVDITRYGNVSYQLGVVERLTPKQVEVLLPNRPAPLMFWRESGLEVKGDKYYPRRLCPLTDEVRAVWRREQLLRRVESIVWRNQPLQVLEAVVAALKVDAKVQPTGSSSGVPE